MAVISMDANDRAGRRATPRSPFHSWNAVASRNVETDKQPTEFGYRLLQLMGNAGLKAAGLARLSGLGASTVSRMIYGGVARPDSDTLARVARALVQAGPHVSDFERAVEEKHNELLHAAGYRLGAAPPPVVLHPLVVDLQQMIGDGSPLNADEIQFLSTMVDKLVEPYRRKIRKRTA